jgi:hypothetical protein
MLVDVSSLLFLGEERAAGVCHTNRTMWKSEQKQGVNNLHWVMDWEYGNGLSRILPTK